MKLKSALLVVVSVAAVGAQAQMAPIPEETKQLAYLAGKWEGEATYDFMGAAKGKAIFTAKLGVGGRYLTMEHTYSMPGMGDMEGLQIVGFDAEKKEWVGWWYDSMEFGSMELRGNEKDGTMTIVSQPMTVGGMDKTSIRQVLKKVSDTKIEVVLTMKSGDGDWGPMMSVTYTKK